MIQTGTVSGVMHLKHRYYANKTKGEVFCAFDNADYIRKQIETLAKLDCGMF